MSVAQTIDPEIDAGPVPELAVTEAVPSPVIVTPRWPLRRRVVFITGCAALLWLGIYLAARAVF